MQENKAHRPKTIFITGSEGFVGKELVKKCHSLGYKTVCVDLPKVQRSGYFSADINKPEIAEFIPEGADAIIHLAALSRDSDCKNKAYECFTINVMGTLNLMQAAEQRNVKQFIFASTEWVYENFVEGEEKTEDSIINIANHTSEYALSKLVSEANFRQKSKHGFCPVTILRFGIIYGSRKDNWSAVESLFNQVRTQDKITVGSLRTGRCFINVSDIVEGIVKSIGLPGFNIINLESNRLLRLGEVIETSKKILNKNPEIVETTPNNISIRPVSNKKAKELLHWEPKISLEQGLRDLNAFLGDQ